MTVRVALFVPCYVDQLAPEAGLATVRVLERAGCRVHFDPHQTCCGQPFQNAGATREAARLARAHLRRFEQHDAIVCPSASCVSTVRNHYPRLGVGIDAEGSRVRERTFELSEFLVEVLERVDLGARFPHRVALLQSCHGLRELGLGVPSERAASDAAAPGPPEVLLGAVDGIDLVRPERPDECCGFGGLFSVRFPELSLRMARDRLEALRATGAEYVTGTDVSCLLHLDALRRREGAGPLPIHLAEILAAREAA